MLWFSNNFCYSAMRYFYDISLYFVSCCSNNWLFSLSKSNNVKISFIYLKSFVLKPDGRRNCCLQLFFIQNSYPIFHSFYLFFNESILIYGINIFTCLFRFPAITFDDVLSDTLANRNLLLSTANVCLSHRRRVPRLSDTRSSASAKKFCCK